MQGNDLGIPLFTAPNRIIDTNEYKTSLWKITQNVPLITMMVFK